MMKFLKINVFFQILLSTYFILPSFGNKLPENNPIPVINMECQDISLKDFIDKVSMESGYNIIVSEELLVERHSGIHKDINLEQLFHKVFRNHNVFQVIDTEKKELHLYANLKSNQKVYTSKPLSSVKNERFVVDPNTLEIRPGVTLSDVRKQRDERSKRIQNGTLSVNDDGGDPFIERKKRRKQLEEDIDTGAITVDMGNGRTLEDSKKIRKDNADKLKSGDFIMGDGKNITLREARERSAELSRKIQSGEIQIEEDND